MSIKMTHNQQNGKRTIKWERIFANYLSNKQWTSRPYTVERESVGPERWESAVLNGQEMASVTLGRWRGRRVKTIRRIPTTQQ